MTAHAAEARRLAADMPHSEQAALVHATLALAEQQRAANLIAYERLHIGRPDHDGRRAILAVPRSFVTDEIDRLLDIDQIAEQRTTPAPERSWGDR